MEIFFQRKLKNLSTFKYSKKIVQPSDDEILKHKKFLKNELKKNFY